MALIKITSSNRNQPSTFRENMSGSLRMSKAREVLKRGMRIGMVIRANITDKDWH